MIVWFLSVIVFTGLASSALRKPYGDAITAMIGRLAVTACLFLLVWRLGWLKAYGIIRFSPWPVWFFALGGMIYFASASLYSLYGKSAFNFSRLIRLPAVRPIVLMHFVAGLSEEILFRGVLLYALIRVWGHTKQSMICCILLTSLLFCCRTYHAGFHSLCHALSGVASDVRNVDYLDLMGGIGALGWKHLASGTTSL